MNANIQKPPMGVLHLSEGEKKFRLNRHAPSADIGFFVKHYWIINWDLTGQEPYFQDVLPNPCVNLAIEEQRSGIFKPLKHVFSQRLEGKGRVFGVKFKPGGFYPFVKRPVSGLIDHPIKIMEVFEAADLAMEQAILSQEDEGRMVQLAESFLRSKLPERDEQVAFINRMIDRIMEDRDITMVEHICERFSINKRTLQRMFDQYVGVSPKWVIQLYRLHNAAHLMERGQYDDWSKLSAELGYYDQSHFIKDFKAIIGKTPDEYTRQNQG